MIPDLTGVVPGVALYQPTCTRGRATKGSFCCFDLKNPSSIRVNLRQKSIRQNKLPLGIY